MAIGGDTGPPSETHTFGALLKLLRRRARLTQNQLASAVGYTREHLARLESDSRPVDATVVQALFVPALELGREPALAARLVTLARQSHANRGAPIAASAPPAQLTGFVGRTEALRDVSVLLGQHRLVTLIGPGGVGKTRLALALAGRLATRWRDGVVFAELAPVQDAGSVPSAVATACGLPASAPASSALTAHLRDKQVLLVVDNCEHVLAACADLIGRLLRECPQLGVLATSRASFGMLGATVFRVPSLTLPVGSSVEDLSSSEAAELFLSRAQAQNPELVLDPKNARAVARICARLDGVPLALELAAAQVHTTSLTTIADRLDDRFSLLESGNTFAEPRQRTLRATMDWSHALLSEDERAMFRRLAVFVDGWTLETAQAVGTYATLHALVEKSLVNVETRNDARRYRMLETVREYGLLKLQEAGESESAHAAHVSLCTALAKQADPALRRSEQRLWFARLESEHDNLRAALNWALGRRDAQSALRLTAALWFFWFWRGYWIEGAERTRAALALPHDARSPDAVMVALASIIFASRAGHTRAFYERLPEVRALLTRQPDSYARAWAEIALSFATSDHDKAARHLRAAARHARDAGDDWVAAEALFIEGDRERARGRDSAAARHYKESIAILREIGDGALIAYPIGNLGRLAMARGDLTNARLHFEEAVALCQADGNKLGLADWLLQRATLAVRQRDAASAVGGLREATQLFADIGNAEGVADALVQVAALALQAHDAIHAATLLGAADRILETHNHLHKLVEQAGAAEFSGRVAEARTVLKPGTFAEAWAAGRALALNEAVRLAISAITPNTRST